MILVFCLHSIFKANPYTRKPSNYEFARTVFWVCRQFFCHSEQRYKCNLTGLRVLSVASQKCKSIQSILSIRNSTLNRPDMEINQMYLLIISFHHETTGHLKCVIKTESREKALLWQIPLKLCLQKKLKALPTAVVPRLEGSLIKLQLNAKVLWEDP